VLCATDAIRIAAALCHQLSKRKLLTTILGRGMNHGDVANRVCTGSPGICPLGRIQFVPGRFPLSNRNTRQQLSSTMYVAPLNGEPLLNAVDRAVGY
jgi:hypothetical protein